MRLRRSVSAKAARDAVLFVSGMAGIYHETVVHKGSERPTLLLLFAAMVGLTAFLRMDERRGGQ